MSERIGEKTEIARHEAFDPKDDLGKFGKNEQGEKNSKSRGREKFRG